MAEKVSQKPLATVLNLTDIIYLIQGGISKKATMQLLKDYFSNLYADKTDNDIAIAELAANIEGKEDKFITCVNNSGSTIYGESIVAIKKTNSSISPEMNIVPANAADFASCEFGYLADAVAHGSAGIVQLSGYVALTTGNFPTGHTYFYLGSNGAITMTEPVKPYVLIGQPASMLLGPGASFLSMYLCFKYFAADIDFNITGINKTGSSLSALNVVAIIGISGGYPSIRKAVDADAVKYKLGLTLGLIANDGTGTVHTTGKLNAGAGAAFYGTSASIGDVIYLTSSGAITAVKPTTGGTVIGICTAVYNYMGTNVCSEIDINIVDGSYPVVPVAIPTLATWKSTITYNITDNRFTEYTIDGVSKLYKSLQAGNLNHLPTDAAWWLEVSPDEIALTTSSAMLTKKLSASAGAATYALEVNKENIIQGNLPSGVSSTITLAQPIYGQMNQTVLHFKTGSTAPTIVYSGFTPKWLGGSAISIFANKSYTLVFEQLEETTNGTYITKVSGGEY